MCLRRHGIAPSKLLQSHSPKNLRPTWPKEIAMVKIILSGIIVLMGLTVTTAGVVVIIYG